jgi:hypothetical protein
MAQESGAAVAENEELAHALRKQRKYNQLVEKLEERKTASVQSEKAASASAAMELQTDEHGEQTRSTPSRAASAASRAQCRPSLSLLGRRLQRSFEMAGSVDLPGSYMGAPGRAEEEARADGVGVGWVEQAGLAGLRVFPRPFTSSIP